MPLITRSYESYDHYLEHQKAKLENLYRFEFDRGIDDRLQNFRDRIRHAARHLSGNAVLCLGARFGEEVLVFRELGFTDSIGIDIAPGTDESLVRRGDFHNTGFNDASFDAAYTNAVDHVFDLPRFATETRRVLKPGGHLVLAATNAFDNPDTDKHTHIDLPNKFESLLWENEHDLLAPFQKEFSLTERFDSTAWSETVFVLAAK
jgi:SAM-dependent methyltransferase